MTLIFLLNPTFHNIFDICFVSYLVYVADYYPSDNTTSVTSPNMSKLISARASQQAYPSS